jgi:hypothetical protein
MTRRTSEAVEIEVDGGRLYKVVERIFTKTAVGGPEQEQVAVGLTFAPGKF